MAEWPKAHDWKSCKRESVSRVQIPPSPPRSISGKTGSSTKEFPVLYLPTERDKKMGKFVIKETATGFKFDLKAGNGEVIATSEVYNSKAACLNGVKSVKANCVGEIEDQTADPIVAVKHPKFEIYEGKSGDFRFRLKAKNGQIIATSEGYTSKAGCENGIASVKKNAPEAELVEAE